MLYEVITFHISRLIGLDEPFYEALEHIMLPGDEEGETAADLFLRREHGERFAYGMQDEDISYNFV